MLQAEKSAKVPRCTLVGAGPGAADLLTLRAIRAIRAATVLLVDDLVSDEVLRWARKSARIVHVGKRGGCRSTPQEFIERLMIDEARKGERVVRLKGGDPFVFGRGGEEAEHLREAGIEVEVVNGITSGLAAATALGAPLTHRDHAHGVIFVTGHPRQGADALDWDQLGRTAAQGFTLVIYMGVAQAASIEAALLRTLPEGTPLAIVQHASQPQQRHAVATLGALRRTLEQERLGSPAVIVVGEVMRGLLALRDAPRREHAA
ncbi:uroporphyrinogen-III C-methyltransferase [Caldimonas tepidiphila]|uniref:uroporphyrinogen-III C-methyltransferase n=1 Tax=Caldimonas tepidiphila TaxID=2315841 RepID=UPI000E5B4A86|nr:uroporphyrinogen-III C-methyltransferase [Caldimonas tepidiphila]